MEENNLGEMIAYWISKKGYLDLSTSEEEVRKFYESKEE